MNNNGSQLEHWPRVTLGSICAQDRQIVEAGSADFPSRVYLSLEHIEAETGRILRTPSAPMEDEGKSTTFQFDSRHVLYGKLRPYLNKVALPNFVGRCTTEIIPLKCSNGISRDFLAFLLRREETVAFAMKHKTGSRMPRADMDVLLTLEIPLPPLAERERIAARLTEQLAAIESARAAAQARLASAEALPAAYLREVFEGPEASEWETLQIGETCELLPSKSISTAGDAVVRAITTACLSETGFLPGGIKTARMRAADVPECIVRSGEILVARSNTPELVGRAAIFNGEPAGIVATDLTIRVWPCRHVESSFLAAFLSYLFQTGYWKEKSGGASGTMKKITREQLLALEFRVPPGNELDSIEDQRRTAAALALRLAETKRLTAVLREELAAIDALPAALLREAFNGEA